MITVQYNGRLETGFLQEAYALHVRRWLKLLHDTPISFVHASVKDGGLDGGLAVSWPGYTIPLMQRKRLMSLRLSTDPVVAAVAASSHVSEALERLSRPRPLAGLPVSSPAGLVRAAAAALHGTCDGRGLANSREGEKYNRWVNSGSGLMSGQDYIISAIKRRGNVISTAMRCARCLPEANFTCDANFRQPGSLGHILQSCYRTSGPRIRRYDAVINLTETTSSRRGWSSCHEPATPTPAGTRKPDLVVWRESNAQAVVIDVTVVADNASLSRQHYNKVAHYDSPAVREHVSVLSGKAEVVFSSVTLSWRGVISAESAHLLDGDLGWSRNEVELIAVRYLICSSYAARNYREATGRLH